MKSRVLSVPARLVRSCIRVVVGGTSTVSGSRRIIPNTPYFEGTADSRAAGLGEAHADVVLQVLKRVTKSAYIDSVQRKLVK